MCMDFDGFCIGFDSGNRSKYDYLSFEINTKSVLGCQVGAKLWQFWKRMWPEIAAASPPHHGFAIFRVF